MYSSVNLKKRIIALSIVFLLGFFVIIGRLYVVQVHNSKFLQSKALDQWLRDIPTQAKRGAITDRNGLFLVSSYSVYDIYVRHTLVEDVDHEAEIYANVLNLDKEQVKNKISDYTISEVLLVNGATKAQVEELLNLNINSFVASESFNRNYNYDSLLSQIVGFTSSDGIGLTGLESYYDTYLKGVKGISLVDGDAKGSELENSKSYYIPSISGLNLELTIDFMIQAKLETILKKALSDTMATSVSSLVMDPNTGEILAVCTLPSYDLNNIPRDDLESLNKLSRAFTICDSYEPGSTFKTIVAAIALDLGVTSIDHGYYCPGYRIVDGVRTNCHKKTGHGPQTLTTGFINSCNCVFMQVVSDIGIDNFYKYVELFHFDSVLGIDYPGECSGIVIDKDSAMLNDFLRMGFGQSIAISALQLASSVSACITDGYLMQPFFVKKIYADDGTVVYTNEPTRLNKVVDEKIVDNMRYIMSQVVLRGGGKASQVEGHTVGGKTGTAQKYDNGVVSTGNYIGSYVCFSPVEDPKYLVVVIIDEPRTSIYGNIVATPVAGEILKEIYKLKGEYTETVIDEDKLIEMPDCIGKTLTEAGSILAGLGLYYVTEGEGDIVSYQSVKAGEKISVGSSVMIKF